METPKTKAVMAMRIKKFNRAFDNPICLRWDNTHFTLLEVSEILTQQGFECFTAEDKYRRERVDLVYAYKDGKRLLFGFSEVPFRWWINNSIITMSGKCLGDVWCVWGMKDQYAYPFSLEFLMGRAKACSSKELEEYERMKTDRFYVRLGNFPALTGNS